MLSLMKLMVAKNTHLSLFLFYIFLHSLKKKKKKKTEIEVPLLLELSYNKMDPINADEHVGFSRKVINHPSEQKNGCANPNLKSTGCGASSSQAEVGAQQQLKHGNTEMQDDLFWLTDGTPYFQLILAKSHVRCPYTLVMPVKMQPILPEKKVPVILTCENKSWKMTYLGDNRSCKRLDSKWRQFVVDNNLKIGDGCVFELLKCTEALIKFRVKVLSGDFPAELLARMDGHCSKSPIVLD